MTRKFIRFRRCEDAQVFDGLLTAAGFKYTYLGIKLNDRKGTRLFEFSIEIKDQSSEGCTGAFLPQYGQ